MCLPELWEEEAEVLIRYLLHRDTEPGQGGVPHRLQLLNVLGPGGGAGRMSNLTLEVKQNLNQGECCWCIDLEKGHRK